MPTASVQTDTWMVMAYSFAKQLNKFLVIGLGHCGIVWLDKSKITVVGIYIFESNGCQWELDLGPGSDLEDEMSEKSEGEENFE